MSMPTSDGSGSSTSSGPSIERSIFPDIQRDAIVLGENLGVGTFGAVFSGTWTLPDSQKRAVALKKVFVLEKEAEILSKIRHKNIIQFYGICKAAGNDFYIVTECAQRGSLYDYIHAETTTNTYSFDEVVKWALQIASGIHYLHYDAVDTIIHRDLKSKNVVLDKNLICKICDFGTSKDLTHSCTAPSWGGTAAWMSPEMILQNEGLTTATDVWSYGVVLWEILSKEVPYKDHTEYRIFTMITQNGITLAIPPSCPNQLKQLMNNCWKMEPKERTNMRQISNDLSKMEKNPKVMHECEKFLELEDWKTEIAKQEKNVEKLRKDLEKRRVDLDKRERVLNQRVKLEHAVNASARHPPEDVHQWSEHHTSHWIDTILGRTFKTFPVTDKRFLDRVNAAVFRNRITGARLMEMTQNDLEHIGVTKLGSRIELMKAIKRLKENQHALINFPTLHQANLLEMTLKTEKEAAALILNELSLVIIVGMYVRKIGKNIRKFKFYVDSDWADEDMIESKPLLKHASAFIKSVCFSVLNEKTKKSINEPSCAVSHGMTSTPEWVTVDLDSELENSDPSDQGVEIKCIVSICYADTVTQPRNTEIVHTITSLEESQILTEKEVNLKLRRSSSSSVSVVASPVTPIHQPHLGFHHAVSSPQLRGFWHRKANMGRHGLTETQLSTLQEKLRTPSPSPTDTHRLIIPPPQSPNRNQKSPRRRRTTTTSEDTNSPDVPIPNLKSKPTVHGGMDKCNWKNRKSRPKFS